MWAELSLAADGAMMTGSALEISYPDWVDKCQYRMMRVSLCCAAVEQNVGRAESGSR